MSRRPTLVFVSVRNLFPADSGGKIRTAQILRGMKGGLFRIHLVMPCTEQSSQTFARQIDTVCDELSFWQEIEPRSPQILLRRALGLFSPKPVAVITDESESGRKVVCRALRSDCDLVVFDFPHSVVLSPDSLECPSVLFTHNIEAEIYKRHIDFADSSLRRWLWRNQYRKMLKFERRTLRRFSTVIAVSERDRDFFHNDYEMSHCVAIPTGVDVDFFEYTPPHGNKRVVFCGSMDWMANIDAVEWFAAECWSKIKTQEPKATMTVVGRSPPASLVSRITRRFPDWKFTGFVEDIREHVAGTDVFVIPLRVGGGTRIKAFEAMAMGVPVVSTDIGIEGLPVENDVHYLGANDGHSFAHAVASLLGDSRRGEALSTTAREFVANNYSYRVVAEAFERACQQTLMGSSDEKENSQRNTSAGGG